MKFNIYSYDGYVEAVNERQELMDFRDKVEENGGSTTGIEERIDELSDGIVRYRKEYEEC